MSKQAILIIDPHDFGFVFQNFNEKDTVFLAATYNVLLSQPNHATQYFYPPGPGGDSKDLDSIYFMALNWFRDDSGKDMLAKNGFSCGTIIARTIISAFANDFRNYLAISYWLTKVDVLFASKNESPSFHRVACFFGDRIRWYDPGHQNLPTHRNSPERTVLFEYPTIHRYSWAARLLQLPFLPFVRRRKHLYFTDWTSIDEAKKCPDTMVQNSFKPWQGCYLKLSQHYIEEAEAVFPKQLNPEAVDLDHLRGKLQHAQLHWDDILTQIFQRILLASYTPECRAIIIRTYAVYKELFVYYKPNKVSLPSEVHFAHVLAMQVAHSLGIKTQLIIDGYQLMKDPSTLYRDENNNKFLVDRFVCQGPAHRDLMLSSGVNPGDCIFIKPTICNVNQKLFKQKTEYDVIVMYLYPHLHNPHARWDSAYKNILEVVSLLRSLGKKRIAIKAKPEGRLLIARDLMAIRGEIKSEEILQNVDILTGPLYEHIQKAECVVGQISTAVLEAFYHDIPYFIYEPYENGKTDRMISSSNILKLDRVARDIEQLKGLILSGKSSLQADRDYLLGGVNLSEVVF